MSEKKEIKKSLKYIKKEAKHAEKQMQECDSILSLCRDAILLNEEQLKIINSNDPYDILIRKFKVDDDKNVILAQSIAIIENPEELEIIKNMILKAIEHLEIMKNHYTVFREKYHYRYLLLIKKIYELEEKYEEIEPIGNKIASSKNLLRKRKYELIEAELEQTVEELKKLGHYDEADKTLLEKKVSISNDFNKLNEHTGADKNSSISLLKSKQIVMLYLKDKGITKAKLRNINNSELSREIAKHYRQYKSETYRREIIKIKNE